jgi:hypothetical protein
LRAPISVVRRREARDTRADHRHVEVGGARRLHEGGGRPSRREAYALSS